MTRFHSLIDYWLESPPVHISLAAVLRVKGRGKKNRRTASESFGDDEEFPRMMGAPGPEMGPQLTHGPMKDGFRQTKMRTVKIDRTTIQ